MEKVRDEDIRFGETYMVKVGDRYELGILRVTLPQGYKVELYSSRNVVKVDDLYYSAVVEPS